MSLAIIGFGTAVPGTIIQQTDARDIARALCCRTAEQQTWLPAMYDGTGIASRHLSFGDEVVRDVIDGTRYSGSIFLPSGEPDDQGPTTEQRMRHYAGHAPPLAITASRQALERSGLTGAKITHLITISCTGFLAPGIDVALIHALDLSPSVARTHIGYMGCHGALNGLRVARAFADSDPGARVLVCAVELCSVHYHYGWDPQKMIANAIFADGAAALVGLPDAHAPADEWRAVGSGSCLVPKSTDAMTWRVGNHGFEMTLSKRVPGLIATHLRPWLVRWLSEHDLRVEDVASWAIHPGGPRIVAAAEEALGLPRASTATARAVFAAYGNMSSPTILFILDQMRRERAPRPCVALGFGPGLMVEALLLR